MSDELTRSEGAKVYDGFRTDTALCLCGFPISRCVGVYRDGTEGGGRWTHETGDTSCRRFAAPAGAVVVKGVVAVVRKNIGVRRNP